MLLLPIRRERDVCPLRVMAITMLRAGLYTTHFAIAVRVFPLPPFDSYSRKSSPSLLAGLILSKTAEVQNSVFAVAFPPRVRRDSSASRGRAPGLRHGLDSVLDDAEGFVRRARSGQRGARGGGNHGSRRGSGREGAAVGKEWMSAVCHIFGALLLLKVLLTWG